MKEYRHHCLGCGTVAASGTPISPAFMDHIEWCPATDGILAAMLRGDQLGPF